MDQTCWTRVRLRHVRLTDASRIRSSRLYRSLPDPPKNGTKKAQSPQNTFNFIKTTTFLANMFFILKRFCHNEAILGGQSHGSVRRFAGGRDKHGSATPRSKRLLGVGVRGA